MFKQLRQITALVALGMASASPVQAQSVDSIITALAPNYGVESGSETAKTATSIVTLVIPQTSVQVVVDMQRNVDFELYFAFDSAALSDRGKDVLNKLGRALLSDELNTQRFLLAGHTDAAGDDAYNLELSQRRALAAKDYLVEVFAIDADRLVNAGYGETRLANGNDPYAGENRRVAITLIPDLSSVQPQAAVDTTPVVDVDLSSVQITVGTVQHSSGEVDCEHQTDQSSSVPLDLSLDSYGSGPTRLPCDSGVFADTPSGDNFVNSVISN